MFITLTEEEYNDLKNRDSSEIFELKKENHNLKRKCDELRKENEKLNQQVFVNLYNNNGKGECYF